MGGFVAEFYENGDKIPVKDFLDSLNVKMREPYSKPLGDGIFELRAKVGTDISRVLYFFYYEGRIVLTHGFIKKTQRTPAGEIEKAKKYRRDYIERHGE